MTLEQTEIGVWQDLFTSIIEDADANILLLDDEFKVINLNPGFYWIFLESYGVELRRGTSILKSMELVDPSLTRLWKQRCMTALGGSSVKVEEVFEVDGRTYYWEIHFKSEALREGGQIISVFSRDVTIRKAYQKRILENESNLRSILDTLENSLWLVNTQYELIDFNKTFYQLYKSTFGVRLARGKSIIELIPDQFPELRQRWQERYESGLKGKPGKFMDSYVIEGETRTFEVRSYPITTNGEVTGLTIYSREITKYKKAEDLLKTQNEELIKINSELDRFVYSASHDLRAPLMSVKGILNMIRIDPDKKNLDHYVGLIETSVNKLDNFISDIIHYSRNSRMDIVAKSIDFKELVSESIASLKYMEEAEQVRSIIKVETNDLFYSDASRLLIIFNNIISNAVRYRDRWKDSYLRISIVSDAKKAVISFEDNGVGIAPEFQDKIFKMFFRASADSKGSGLGLYIVKSTVEKLNGTIRLNSKLGEGATFVIEIPNLKTEVEN